MMHPYQVTHVVDTLHRKIAVHLVINLQDQHMTVNEMLHFIPTEIPQWGKMKLLLRQEIIRTAAVLGDGDSEKGFRDNTFVKVRHP